MGIFSGVGEFLFGKKPDVAAAQAQMQQGTQQGVSAINQGQNQALSQLLMGLNNASSTLQPTINQGNQYQNDIRSLLMGNSDISQMPGYNAMSSSRRDAIGDLGTGMAGTGKFFSGTTAEQAANIGGGMENQFRQQLLQNLFMGAQPGQQATNQLAGFQMGAGQTGAQIPMTAGANIANLYSGGGNAMANMTMADQSQGAFGDILGAAATLGGAYLGAKAPVPGGALGSAAGGKP